MNNRMVRFLNSIGINDVESFDMDFDLVARNQFDRNQVDMMIVKDTPWDFHLLERFQDGLNIIGYPYTIKFSYKIRPTVYDAIKLFDDWHRLHNRYPASIRLEGTGGMITFVYSSDEEKEQYEQVVKEFKDFLEFLDYRFDFDHEVREEEKSGPNVTKRQMERLEAKANKVIEETVEEEETETSYYKDQKDIEEEQEELRQVEEEYIKNLKENLEQMKSDQKKGGTYKNWRDKIP